MQRILILFFLFASLPAFAQVNDTTIYKIVEEMPRFPGCEALDTTVEVKNQCAQTALLAFFNRNIVYPLTARQENVEGTVVITFIVEKGGYISAPAVVKDIGGGCGEEALRVANGMNEALKKAQLTWTSGKKSGKPVRTQVTLPIRFKLQEPLDFVMVDYDTVYVELDDSLQYKGGEDALNSFIQGTLQYPEKYRDSCKIGSMDLTVLVKPDGYVRVLDVADYWNLGYDFRWEAIKATTATWGNWQAATRKNREVPAAYDFTLSFTPKSAACKQKVADFEKAHTLAETGSALFNEGKKEEGIQKLNEALALFPNNANFLYLRGQAYMNMEKMAEACEDFIKVRSIVSIDLVNQLIPLVCK
jgi:tetratricopeptide (TPR) repeat protein